MKIYFVRHGESVANTQDLEQGPDELLSGKGREQAAFVAERFADVPVARIIASPYERTKVTAEIIGARIGKDVEFSELFVERRPPSELIGKPGGGEEYMKIRALWEKERLIDPSWRYSDEETFTEHVERAKKALAFLIAESADNALVVTHAGFLKMLFAVMMFGDKLTYAMFLDIFNTLKTKNTGVTIVEYKEDANAFFGGWKIHAWNDHAHI